LSSRVEIRYTEGEHTEFAEALLGIRTSAAARRRALAGSRSGPSCRRSTSSGESGERDERDEQQGRDPFREVERRTPMRKLWVKAWITLDGVFDADTMKHWWENTNSPERMRYITEE
jgi:hypothetical protein